ncbi:MAG TPA: peptidylprolyl isomerase [Kofleriaceae bacterium]|nr:peptidylprolyl isomerase [Kofleriaceae bacterium]
MAALPPLIAQAPHATFTPVAPGAPPPPAPPNPYALGTGPTVPPPGPPIDPALILPPRPTGRLAVAAPKPRWPAVVIALSCLATATSIAVLAWPRGSANASPGAPAKSGSADRAKPLAEAPSPVTPPAVDDTVRAPLVADLTDYTKDLPGWGNPRATIETPMGTIHCELYADKAPMTVANFVGLATGKKPWLDPSTKAVQTNKPFYNGLTFHRVIEQFMIQGGDPLGTGTGGPGYQFGDEFDPELKIDAGALAMANAGPGTNGSQFFIAETRASWLDGRHTVFGKCGDLDVVRKIARVPQDAMNKPNTPITMTVTITR